MARKSRPANSTEAPPKREPAPEAALQPWGTTEWGIIAGLVVLAGIIYAQVSSHQFLNFDDPQFVFFNKAVHNGDLRWAFTSTELTWLPLTWISYMIDYRLFGLNAGGFLIVNAIMHAASACLLFVALRVMTRAMWPSAVVAALFAVHPAHVESVAWIAERKDVLSTLFATVALLCYAKRKLWLTAFAMALSLMAKQTYVTLPFVFLLLDYWPLRRLRKADDLRRLLIEKLPLFALTIAACIVAVTGQESLGSINSTAMVPMSQRIANGLVGYARYLGMAFFPIHLAALYPVKSVASGTAILAAVLLIAVTAVVWRLRKRAPYVLVGWLWFLGVLVPLIGLIPLGGAAIADRYTYFAYTGIFIAVTWSVAQLKMSREQLAGVAACGIAICTVLAQRQASYWKDCDTLFTHTIESTGDNPIAEFSLGQYLQLSDPERALVHLKRAIDLGKDYAGDGSNAQYGWLTESYVAAGMAYMVEARKLPQGQDRVAKVRDSIEMSQQALRIDPSKESAKRNIAYARQLLPAPAQKDYTPLRTYLEQGVALSAKGQFDGAVAQFRKAVEYAPEAPEPHVYLALGLLQAKNAPEAVSELNKAKAIDPVAANDILTRALHLQPSPGNLDSIVAQVQGTPAPQ